MLIFQFLRLKILGLRNKFFGSKMHLLCIISQWTPCIIRKKTFNGLLKVIGIQINLSVYFTFTSYSFYSQIIERTNVLKTTSGILDFIAYICYNLYILLYFWPESCNTNISQQLFYYKKPLCIHNSRKQIQKMILY